MYKTLDYFSGLPGSQIINKFLRQKNVKDLFIYSGGAIMPVIDTFHNQKDFNLFVHTNEQSLGYAATGYAKSLVNYPKPAVCLVTSGPGLTHMVTPMLDAQNDSVPMIVFSGQVPVSAMGKRSFQECPATEITKSVTKLSYCVKHIQELPILLEKSYKLSLDGKPGVIHIDLPKCINNKSYDFSTLSYDEFININEKIDSEIKINTYKMTKPVFHISDLHDLKNAAMAIRKSSRPILMVGKGCNHISSLIGDLVNSEKIPITTTIHSVGTVDENNPLSLQMLGMHGSVAANNAIQKSDCIIAIGCRFDDRTTGNLDYYAPQVRDIIFCNISLDEIRFVNSFIDKINYNFCEDSEKFVLALLEQLNNCNEEKKDRTKWLDYLSNLKTEVPFKYDQLKDKMKTQEVIIALNDQLEANFMDKYIITTGVGNHQMMTSQFITWQSPNTMITSGSLGVMGVGLPYAIGAKIANPDKIVIDIDGDSSFNQTFTELITAKKYNIPVKVMIMNDGEQSMVKVWEELFFEGRFVATSCETNPNYAMLANSMGIKGITCRFRNELDNTISEMLNYNEGPIVCDFKVESDKCFPLVAPGKALDDLILCESQINIPKNILPPS